MMAPMTFARTDIQAPRPRPAGTATRAIALHAALAQSTAEVVERGGHLGLNHRHRLLRPRVGETTEDLMGLIGAARSFASLSFFARTRNAELLRGGAGACRGTSPIDCTGCALDTARENPSFQPALPRRANQAASALKHGHPRESCRR